jgi:hypothetical protein
LEEVRGPVASIIARSCCGGAGATARIIGATARIIGAGAVVRITVAVGAKVKLVRTGSVTIGAIAARHCIVSIHYPNSVGTKLVCFASSTKHDCKFWCSVRAIISSFSIVSAADSVALSVDGHPWPAVF